MKRSPNIRNPIVRWRLKRILVFSLNSIVKRFATFRFLSIWVTVWEFSHLFHRFHLEKDVLFSHTQTRTHKHTNHLRNFVCSFSLNHKIKNFNSMVFCIDRFKQTRYPQCEKISCVYVKAIIMCLLFSIAVIIST